MYLATKEFTHPGIGIWRLPGQKETKEEKVGLVKFDRSQPPGTQAREGKWRYSHRVSFPFFATQAGDAKRFAAGPLRTCGKVESIAG